MKRAGSVKIRACRRTRRRRSQHTYNSRTRTGARHNVPVCHRCQCHCVSAEVRQNLTVVTEGGTVLGSHHGECRSFFGIPYAAPPIGHRRWALPQRVIPWGPSVRDCTTDLKPACWQSDSIAIHRHEKVEPFALVRQLVCRYDIARHVAAVDLNRRKAKKVVGGTPPSGTIQ